MKEKDKGRGWHYLKPLAGEKVPRDFVIMDIEDWVDPAPDNSTEMIHRFRLGCWQRVYRHHGEWRSSPLSTSTTAKEMVEGIIACCPQSSCTWIVAHGLGHDLNVMGFWNELETDQFVMAADDPDAIKNDGPFWQDGSSKLPMMVLGDPPTIISGIWRGKRVVVVDSLNYWRHSLAELGKEIGLEKLKMPANDAPLHEWLTYCARDVEILSTYWIQFLGAWIEDGSGPWGYTISTLAWNLYRRHYLPDRKILIHGDERALKIERLGYYGGETWVGYVGEVVKEGNNVEGHSYHDGLAVHISRGDGTVIDANSLYPAAFATKPMPIRLLGRRTGDGGFYGAINAVDRVVVGFVRVATEYPCYPCRVDPDLLQPLLSRGKDPARIDRHATHRVVFPVGIFDTVLTGPELRSAFEAGHVTEIHEWYEYAADVLGEQFVADMVEKRQRARDSGHVIHERLAKLMMNSLIGKFGQQSSDWIAAPEEWAACLWGSWVRANADNGEMTILRSLGGRVQKQRPRGETDNSCPVIAATVTAYARLYMRRWREKLGPRACYYQDVDSLHLDGAYLDLVANELPCDPIAPGAFKVQSLFRRATYLGKKAYCLDRQWTVSGIKSSAKELPDRVWRQWQMDGIQNVMARGPHQGLRSKEVVRRVRTTDAGGIVGTDGWVEPYEVRPG